MQNSIPEFFFETARKLPKKTALLYKKEGVYLPITYQELSQNIVVVSNFLHGLGIQKNDHVAILSENRPEWVISDIAIMSLGAVSVPLHTTFNAEALGKILNHSRVKVIIVSNANLLNKVLLCMEKLTFAEKIIFMGQINTLNTNDAKYINKKIISWKEICLDKNNTIKAAEKISLHPSDVCSIIYTSGSTGEPKGVVLTHENFLSNIETINQLIPVKTSDVFLSFLPLSHVLERTGGYYVPLLFGATIAYAEGIKQLPHNLKEVRPSVLISVPRIFEKFHDAIWDKVNAGPAWRKKLFLWALKQKNDTFGHTIADIFVFKKIRAQMGGNLRLTISGGASLNQNICRFFSKIGVVILEGYGLTETSPVISLNTLEHKKFGSVGNIIPGVEVSISEQKEILVRGPNVFKEYFKNEAETVAAFNADKWFLTGDLGFLDHEGFLTIIGRKKEMMVLSNGKKVWPEAIENILNNDKYISQSMVVGNRQNFVGALIVPDWQEIEIFFKSSNMPMQSHEKLIKNPFILNLFQKRIDEKINPAISDVEKIKKFILLPQEFSQEKGQLTPTLKLRRHIIDMHYKKLIEGLYV